MSSNYRPFTTPSSITMENQYMSPISKTGRSSPADSDQTGITEIELDPCYLNDYDTPRDLNNTFDAALRSIGNQYEIKKKMLERLLILQDYEIIIVCDDSASMRTPVDGTQRTRWDELCSIVKIMLGIGVIFDSNGVDIYFLNRKSYLKVKDPRQIDQAFRPEPRGYTPLVPVLTKIFESPLAHRGREKKLLVFVATDGLPTDDDGEENVRELEHLMRQVRDAATTYVSFLICTDDPACVDYLGGWDESMTNVDVTDDFDTERKLVRRYRGSNFPFSFGDYVVKAMLGAIDPEFDAYNEPI